MKMSSFWHHHPGVRTGNQLTLGERAVDRVRNRLGSWGFVFACSSSEPTESFDLAWTGSCGRFPPPGSPPRTRCSGS